MAMAGVVVKVKSESKENLRGELEKMNGVEIETESPQGELILLVESENIKSLHKLCVKIEKLSGVLGVYPSYVTTEDEKLDA